jgi:acylphosphatase
MSSPLKIARRYFVRGRVQGVGFRYFVEKTASALRLNGYVRNLDDGRVEVYAIGTAAHHGELAGHLWKGPRWADVRGVEEMEASMVEYEGFHIHERS